MATVGQTSLLGSMYLALNPPLGQAPSGVLQPGDARAEPVVDISIPPSRPFRRCPWSSMAADWARSGTSSRSSTPRWAVVRQDRDLLTRLNDFVGLLAEQRDSINAAVTSLANNLVEVRRSA